MKTQIRVTGVENKGKKMNIIDNGTKYNFWVSKQDGNPTKAMEGFQKLRPIIGDTLNAEVESKDASFTNDQGKTINYKDNQILYFYTDVEQHQNSQVPASQPQMPQQVNQEIPTIQIGTDGMIEDTTESRVSKLEVELKKAYSDIKLLSERVSALEKSDISIDEVPF